MQSIYTKKGDTGETGLLGEGRTSKASLRIETLGALDETSASLGVARTFLESNELIEIIFHVQKDLYNVMAEVGATIENAILFRKISEKNITWLEEQIEILITITGSPKEFIIPGEIRSSAHLSLARTIVRRAERRMVELHNSGELENPYLLTYINRLSSLCFAMELFENHQQGTKTRNIKEL